MNRWTTAAVLAALTALPAIEPVWAGKKDDTLNFAVYREVENYDFYFNTAREGILVQQLAWDNLIERDPKTGEYKPLLAKSFKWIDDVTMELELREGIKFHNGEPFDADSAVFTINWVSNPDNKVITQANVNWMKNAEKLGPYKIRIHLKQPFPAALEYLAGTVPMYPKDYYAKVGPQGMGREPVGTGPYKVISAKVGDYITFLKNPDYFKDSPKGQPGIGRITMRTIRETNTQVAELLTGGLDWIWQVPADQAEKLAANPQLTIKAAETMRIGYIGMDAAGRAGDTPMKNLKVRQAVAHAVNREAIVKNLIKGDSRVVHAACFPSQFGCTDEVQRYAFDPARAKALLAEAGYPNGFDIDIYAYRERSWTEAVIGDLRSVGIRARLQYLSYASLRDKNQAGETALFHMTWGSNSVNDVSAILGVFFGKGMPDDYARDVEIHEWLKIADNSVDPNTRKTNYTKALQKIAAQAYWVPTYTYVVNVAFTRDLNFTPDADEIPRFVQARWK
jgi:peptide/nickel transport system substrate-binding protein